MTQQASPIPYPYTDGVRMDASSIELNLAGNVFFFTACNYSRKRTRTQVRVNHPDPVGKTRGTNEYAADVELLIAEWNLFLAQVQQDLGPGYGDVPFSVTVTYTENGFDTIQDVWLGCTIDSTEVSQSAGADPLKRKMEFSPLKILFNGVDDLATPLVGAPAQLALA